MEDLLQENPELPPDQVSYCRSIAKTLLIESVESESKAFLSGFFDVIPKSHFSIFTETELEYLICGT